MKKIKEINGKKILYKYGPGCWLTIVLSLCAIALPVLLIFVFPFFEVSSAFKVSGLNLILKLFQKPVDEITAFKLYVTALDMSWFNDVWGDVILYSMTGVLIAACIFSLTLAIMTIVFLCGGKLTHRKGPFLMSVWIFVFVLLYCAFPIVLMVMEFVKGVPNAFNHYMYDVVCVAAMLLVMILLYVVYAVCMKNRLFMKDLNAIEEYKKRMEMKKSGIPGNDNSGFNGSPIQIIINTGDSGKVQTKDNVINVESNEEPVVEQNQKTVTPVVPVAPAPIVAPVVEEKPVVKTEVKNIKVIYDLPRDLKSIGGHAFAKNTQLQLANIPSGIDELGPGAFANCLNLKSVSIPVSVTKIGFNCFFNCVKLETINYQGTKAQWSKVKRGSNWLAKAGTSFVICSDAKLSVDPLK